MKTFQRLLVAAPSVALLHAVMAPASSLANENRLDLDSVQEYSIAQGATIRDFSDVYPTDWAYQALAELIDTYGCVSGYPDGTFRGQQPITRFEMAAVLSSCLDSMSAKMEMMGEESMEDMAKLERLVASFEEELITLKGTVDGLDAKVSELEESQFSTTTKASFKIATDFVYFASEDMGARAKVMESEVSDSDGKSTIDNKEDNSGLALSSSAEVKFTTSFTGSDKLTFKLKGDVLGSDYNYLAMGNFYDVAGSNTNVQFTGFTYKNSLDLGGMSANLILGTDYADFDGLVGLDTYYGGSGYDGYGSDGMFDEFGHTGIGFNVDLLSSNAGTLTASASYAVDKGDATSQMGTYGIFGKDSSYSGALALSWNGALFGGNEALFSVMYRYRDHDVDMGNAKDINKNDWKFVAGAYLTDTLSLSGSYALGSEKPKMKGTEMTQKDMAQWMVAVNLDDAIFPGNSAGVAYGTSSFMRKDRPDNYKVPTVIELYYSFKVNDHFEFPVYLDFISNSMGMSNTDAFGIAVRPTLTF